MKKNDTQKTIKLLLDFKNKFDNIQPKLSRKFLGDIGEFYVLAELEKRFKEVEYKGGQTGYDIHIKDVKKRIEVKTSLAKNEIYSSDIKYFGWRVKDRKEKEKQKFEIMIGVALDCDFKNPKFYVFTHDEVYSVEDTKIPRFSDKKRIHIFLNKTHYNKACRSNPEFIPDKIRQFNESPSKILNKWNKLKKVIYEK